MRKPLALILFASPLAAQPAHQTPTPPAPRSNPLPITRVALYKNGVGFFEHSGRVTGDESVTIDFTSAQLNDVLQSLTAIDLNGGRISGAGYNSTTPLDQQLKALTLGLPAKTSFSVLFEALRGARVQVTGAGPVFTGRILSCEMHKTSAGKDSNMLEGRFLTVAAESGDIRIFQITPTLTVRLLDTHTDLNQYLQVLDSNRDQGLRHLTLFDRGPEGPAGKASRDLRVSYISEVPVWKSTYRILFTDPGKPGAPSQTASSSEVGSATLQGWSVVDNTTGTDWINVHLDLIAGAPQSFIQPLSTPYYARRPEIPLPAEAQLAPQTHQSGEEDKVTTGVGSSNGSAGGVAYGQQIMNVTASNSNLETMNASVGSTMGGPMRARSVTLGSGSSAAFGGTISRNNLDGNASAAILPGAYQNLAAASIAPGTTTSAFDDFFEYTLTDPITIRKNESALVPILQTRLPIERVTLWSQQQPVALRALWITNSSNLTLDRGSFSIVENGSFGGEGLLDPIHPGEKRLLSYAADQAVRVTISGNKSTRRINHLKIAKGILTETSIDVAELTYDIHNAAPDPRMVIIEHPIRQGWTLDSEPKAAETTPTDYRFRVATAPAETVHLHVGERHTNQQYIRLVDRTEDQLVLLLKDAHASPATFAALQPIFDAHSAVVDLDNKISALKSEIGSITADQDRLRENMKALKGSPEEKALLTRYTGELNAQEDRLAAINKQIAALQLQRTAADEAFQTKLNALTLDDAL